MALTNSDETGRGAMRLQVAPPVRTTGVALPTPVRHQMEASLGVDLSAVRVHEGHQATLLGAVAYTRGNDIHFAPGRFEPYSTAGREMLGHELTHIVQQRAGRVGPSSGLVAVQQ